MPNVASCSRTTAAPALVVPAPPKCAPRPFSSISASKLSDGTFVWRTISLIGGESTPAISCASGGAVPAPLRPSTPTLTRAQRLRQPARGLLRRRPVAREAAGDRDAAQHAADVAVDGEAGARRAAQVVEHRLVAEHRAVDAADAGPRGDRLRDRLDLVLAQGRVARALEVEVAAPDAVLGVDRPGRHDLRVERRGRPVPQQRGRGRVELLDGRRRTRDVLLVGVERGPGGEVAHVGACERQPAAEHRRATAARAARSRRGHGPAAARPQAGRRRRRSLRSAHGRGRGRGGGRARSPEHGRRPERSAGRHRV